MEWPLPWPRDVRDVPELVPVVDAAARRGARVLLVAGDGPHPGSDHTVCWYRSADPGPWAAAGFVPVEQRCRPEAVVRTALALLAGEPGPAPPSPNDVVDVVVCTHGRRDTCCGGAGTSLYRDLRAASLPRGVRLWRSSHQGGHRFAPTALVLPAGTCWAYLDLDTVQSLLRRDVPPATLIDRYRGCVSFDDPQLQALDGRALAVTGWAWLDAPRAGRRVGPTRLVLEAPDGPSFEGVVAAGAPYRLPPCGSAPGADVELTPHTSLEVMAFTRRAPMEPRYAR